MRCRYAVPILLAALACGCSSLPSYGIKVNAPHKDVLHMVIYLKERAEPAVYQQIALREAARIHAERRQEPPLYEITFEFQKRGSPVGGTGKENSAKEKGKSEQSKSTEERLAKVVIRLQSDGIPGPAEIVRAPAQRIETTLY